MAVRYWSQCVLLVALGVVMMPSAVRAEEPQPEDPLFDKLVRDLAENLTDIAQWRKNPLDMCPSYATDPEGCLELFRYSGWAAIMAKIEDPVLKLEVMNKLKVSSNSNKLTDILAADLLRNVSSPTADPTAKLDDTSSVNGTTTTTPTPSTTVSAPQSEQSGAEQAPPTTGKPDESNVTTPGTDATTTAKPNDAPEKKTEDGPVSDLYWIIPLISVLLIAMGVAGFYLQRHVKKAGYPQSNKANGESRNKDVPEGV